MAEKDAPDLVELAIRLIAEHGWQGFSFADLARQATVPLAVVYAELPNRAAILSALGRRLDAEMLGIDMAELDGMTPRERVFELVMRRLDAMAPYKEGLRTIAHEAARDPMLLGVACCTVARLGRRLVDAAGTEESRVLTALARHAVGAIYARAFNVWLDDDTPDMARTLAELDRRLQQAEEVAHCFAGLGRSRRGCRSPEAEAAA
jgi:AcrR family transcriptional regulator